MSHIIGMRRYARATYPLPRFQQTVDARPFIYNDEITGLSSTADTTAGGVQILRVNAGAALGFDIPEQDAGSSLLLQVNGSVQQDGDGDTGQVWPMVNGVEFGIRISRLLNGFPPLALGEDYVIPLGAGITTIRFNWRCSGHNIQCDPGHATYPCRISVWAMVVRTS